jgi:hypothetical protein
MDKEFMFCRSSTTAAMGDFFFFKENAYLFSVKKVLRGVCVSVCALSALRHCLEHARAKEVNRR